MKIEESGFTLIDFHVPGYVADMIGGYLLKYATDQWRKVGITQENYFDYPLTMRINFIHCICKKDNPTKEFIREVLRKEAKKITYHMINCAAGCCPETLKAALTEMTDKELLQVWKKATDCKTLLLQHLPTTFLPLLLPLVQAGIKNDYANTGYLRHIEDRLKGE